MKRKVFLLLLAVTSISVFVMAQQTPQPPPRPSPPPYQPDVDPGSIQGYLYKIDPYQAFYRAFQWRKDINNPLFVPGPDKIQTKPETVAEVEIMLDANPSIDDAKLAQRISGLTLTERANMARLLRWKARFPGSKTRQALTALADQSAFLDLPAEDIPVAATPSLAEQRHILLQAGIYLRATMDKLPNFSATRQTTYFEDWPGEPNRESGAADAHSRLPNWPMHTTGVSSIPVTYKDGHEVTDRQKANKDADQFAQRLTTAGEFGPILYGVLLDASQSKMAWGNWEQADRRLVAVFRYDVPNDKSHYTVKGPESKKGEQQFAAYRGEIAVDPSNGAILRLTVIAALKPTDPVAEANIQIVYGPVDIGGHSYLCPVQGIALSKVTVSEGPKKPSVNAVPAQTQLNDISFEQYKVFSAQSRSVPESSEVAPANPR